MQACVKNCLHSLLIMDCATGCGICASKCPVEAIIGEKGKAHYIVQDKCINAECVSIYCKFDAAVVN